MHNKRNPIKVNIEIELLTFKDGIGHVDKSRRAGHITEEIAHKLKNELANIYAERIAYLINQGRPKAND